MTVSCDLGIWKFEKCRRMEKKKTLLVKIQLCIKAICIFLGSFVSTHYAGSPIIMIRYLSILSWIGKKNSLIFFRLSILLHLLPGCFLSCEQGTWSYSKINQPFKKGGAFKVIITSYLNVLLLCVWFGWQMSGQPMIFPFVPYSLRYFQYSLIHDLALNLL